MDALDSLMALRKTHAKSDAEIAEWEARQRECRLDYESSPSQTHQSNPGVAEEARKTLADFRIDSEEAGAMIERFGAVNILAKTSAIIADIRKGEHIADPRAVLKYRLNNHSKPRYAMV